jgi:predicted transglutaminase-like cysteine proteinase
MQTIVHARGPFASAFVAIASAACMALASPVSAFDTAAASAAKTDRNRPLAKTRGQPRPDVFGTVALNAGSTRYDARFRRAAAADLSDPLVQQLAAAAGGLDPLAKLKAVQQSVSSRVRWARDPGTAGVADFWANAGETLRRGTGDSADIAIVKMQVLKAAGFDPNRLYITIGGHRARGAHILLLAKMANGYVVLEDHGDRLETPAHHRLFSPVITLGEGGSWLHGRRVGSRIANASLPTGTNRSVRQRRRPK